MKRFNWFIGFTALAFLVAENIHFGWNTHPMSDANGNPVKVGVTRDTRLHPTTYLER